MFCLSKLDIVNVRGDIFLDGLCWWLHIVHTVTFKDPGVDWFQVCHGEDFSGLESRVNWVNKLNTRGYYTNTSISLWKFFDFITSFLPRWTFRTQHWRWYLTSIARASSELIAALSLTFHCWLLLSWTASVRFSPAVNEENSWRGSFVSFWQKKHRTGLTATATERV